MTEQDFLKFHSGYFGEPVDKLGQIARICFTGEELFEYLQDFINQTAPMFEVKVVDRICKNCEKNAAMEGVDICQWCALSDM